MDIHHEPIERRIAWLLGLADSHGEEFRSSESWLARERYLALHPTAIAVLKCMDGRINIPLATNTPVGILMPFRNLGGIFDLGWPHLGEVLTSYVQQMIGQGRQVIVFITYHFSKGDPCRGCAGFNNDTQAAIDHVQEIRKQVEHIFGTIHNTVYPLVCGFETDEDALILHGMDGRKLDLAQVVDQERPKLEAALSTLLPDMPLRMRSDLLPLIQGNLDHIAAVREAMRRNERSLTVGHSEWVICIGRGFDFLHTPNTALIIGPYSPDLTVPVRRAAGIIEANMGANRIPDDGFLLLASVPYDEIGVDRARAEMKSRFLSSFASQVIHQDFPVLADKMTIKTGIVDWRSRRLEILEAG